MKRFLTLFSVFILMFSAAIMTACGGNKYLVSDLGIIELNVAYVNPGNQIYLFDHLVNPFTFTGENEDEYCVCTIEKGYFVHPDGSKANEITLRSNETGYWGEKYPYSINKRMKFVDFVSITIKEGEHIIGYAVIKDEYRGIKCIQRSRFPKVDGEYQDITQKQVDKIMKNVRELNKKPEQF